MIKVDYKKKYNNIYNPKKPSIVVFPDAKYITLDGEGNPNSEYFSESIGALYAIAYAISMSYKMDYKIEGFYNFVVPPLEGVWDIIDGKSFDGNKSNLKWKIMIMMPEFVSEEVFDWAKNRAFIKKKNTRINDVILEYFKGKLCCNYLHKGSYDNEPESFNIMDGFVKENGYKRVELTHREIYLNDARKVDADKLKTVLCYSVEEI